MSVLINDMKAKIYLHDIQGFMELLTGLFERISVLINYLDKNELDEFLSINLLLQNGLNNKDYLYVTDLIAYKLYPIFQKKEQ